MTTQAAEAAVAKGVFARMIGVTPGRVSQYIRENKIGAEALEGEGRSAKIKVEVAKQHLRARLDIGQRLGNGLDTKLTATRKPSPDPELPSEAPLDPAEDGDIDRALKLEKLADAQFRRRKREEEDLARRGIYMPSDQARAQMRKVAERVLSSVEGGLADLAAQLAAKFEIPQRDVLHELRLGMRKIRASVSAGAKARADAMPAIVTEPLPESEDEETAEAA